MNHLLTGDLTHVIIRLLRNCAINHIVLQAVFWLRSQKGTMMIDSMLELKLAQDRHRENIEKGNYVRLFKIGGRQGNSKRLIQWLKAKRQLATEQPPRQSETQRLGDIRL
jgi:hypothetical protein